jgi:acetylornithine deacetylase/succinyl-diaminopimelate desuccinylase-like protein
MALIEEASSVTEATPWNRVDESEVAVSQLQALLRIDTSNPPGNETVAARYLQQVLEKEGIAANLLESSPGRGNLVARLKGTGEAEPLLLVAHLDVVPADASQWEHPPFGGEIHDGWLWGRGALDMKHMAVMSATVLRRLQREGVRLKRDVILAAVADEESGCDAGSRFLVEHHPELVKAEYMLGEVGGYTLHLNGRRYYPVQVAEKGIAWLKLTVKGTPGHGSMPHDDNPVVKLGRILEKLGSRPLPQHNTPAMERFIRLVAPTQPVPARYVMPLLLQPSLSPTILDRLMPDKGTATSFKALLRNTVSPTVFEGGGNINVIPGEASVYLDGRTLPGHSAADLIDELRQLLGTEVTLTVVREAPPVVTEPESPLFECIRQEIAEADPEAMVVPYMIPGFTDAKQFSRLGTRCYGFAPVQMPEGVNFARLYHGHNERIPVDGLKWGLEVLYRVVKRFVAEP